MKGKIKRLIRDLGFGFVRAENGQEVFFHLSTLEGLDFKSIEKGDSVEFDLENPSGLRAITLRTIRR